MAYDKDTVRRANKAGIFDSSTDARILEIERSERVRMKKEFDDLDDLDLAEGTRNQLRMKRQKRNAREQLSRLKSNMKLNLWDRILLWVRGLFGGVLSQFRYLNKKELKRAKNIIQNFSPMFYNFKDPSTVKPRVTKEFGRVIYTLYHSYLKLYHLFEDSVISEDKIDIESDSFFIKYETELLSDTAKNILERLTKERIVELYEHNDNAKIMIERELSNLKNDIEASDYKNIEIYSMVFEAILLLRKLDFKSFFRLFDRNFVPSLKYNPSIKGDIYASELRNCENFIKDLDKYLNTISKMSLPENVGIHFDSVINSFKEGADNSESSGKLDGETAGNVSNTRNESREYSSNSVSIGEGDGSDDKTQSKYENINIISRDIKDFIKTVKTLVRSGVIEAMVKYVYQDSLYESLTSPIITSFFDTYLKVVNYRTLKISSSSENIVKERRLKENIKSLFNVNDGSDINIAFIGNYNPLISKKLDDIKLKTFSHPRSIALVKMFFERHYFKYMTDCIDKLVVEGEFSDKNSGTSFSNNIYELEDDKTELNNFVKFMSESDSIKNLLRGANSSSSLDSSQKNMLSNKITDINTNAKDIIESVLPKLLNIQIIVDKAVSDSKSKTPSFVYNIKTINGLGNRAYINQLTNVSTKIRQFLDIMKNFHLVAKSSFKKK